MDLKEPVRLLEKRMQVSAHSTMQNSEVLDCEFDALRARKLKVIRRGPSSLRSKWFLLSIIGSHSISMIVRSTSLLLLVYGSDDKVLTVFID